MDQETKSNTDSFLLKETKKKSQNDLNEGKIYLPTTIDQDGAYKCSDENSTTFLFFSATIVTLFVFASGTAFSWSSPMIPKLKEANSTDNPLPEPLNAIGESWISSIIGLGAAAGPLVACRLADKVGRKRALLLMALPMLFGFILMIFAKTVLIFLIARFLGGISAGSSFAITPMYLGEIAEDRNRGTVSCLIGVLVAAGILFSYMVGPYLSVQLFNFACLAPVVIFMVAFSIFIPESPVYLIKINKKEEAIKSLMKLRSQRKSQVLKELEVLSYMVEKSESQKGNLFQTYALKKSFFICTGLVIVQQCVGINPVLSYLQIIFKDAGSTIPSDIAAMLIGLVKLLATLATFFLVDKLGRRPLFLLSTTLCGISIISLGIYFYLKSNGYNVEFIFWLPVVSLTVYVIGFMLGLGPLPWAVLGEMFPSNVKASASSFVSCICFLTSFIITLIFPIVSEMLGMAGSFFLFGKFCFLGTLFVYFYMPETKGKNVDEIQRMLSKN